MKPLDEAARDVLRAGRAAERPSAADRARVRHKLEVAMAAGVVGPAIAAPASGAKAWWASKLFLGGAAGGGVAVVAAAVALSLSGSASAPHAVAMAPAATAPEPVLDVRDVPDLAESDEVEVEAPVAPSTPRPQRRLKRVRAKTAEPVVTAPAPVQAAPVPEPRREDDTLEAEAQALHEVQAALRARDSERALALIAEQNRRFPRGQLQPERDGARVLALCASDVTNGTAALSQFVAAHPGSPLLARLKAACAK
ncbi:MAG: hypothetical protein JNK82_06550 [Myxococcaceae bacterium]|nr:hypothetical protein [Myxococcaceae bacterium]